MVQDWFKSGSRVVREWFDVCPAFALRFQLESKGLGRRTASRLRLPCISTQMNMFNCNGREIGRGLMQIFNSACSGNESAGLRIMG